MKTYESIRDRVLWATALPMRLLLWLYDVVPGTFFAIFDIRTQTWDLAMGGWDESDTKVFLSCHDDILFWHLIEYGWVTIQARFCHFLQRFSLPGRIIRKPLEIPSSSFKEPDYKGTFGSYFGTTYGDLWHSFVCFKGGQYLYDKLKRTTVSIESNLDETRERFSHDPSKYKWIEDEIEKHKIWDSEEAAERLKNEQQGIGNR